MPHEVEERYLKLEKRQQKISEYQLAMQQKYSPKRKTHKRLTVSSGTLKGGLLLSPKDNDVRPMMGKVRSAIFSMLLARLGMAQLPSTSRWLDLFAGTGSVGIEAISRGCGSCTFVEIDNWTANEVLKKYV